MEYFCILNIPKRPKFAIITPSNRSPQKGTIKAARKPLHTSFPHNCPSINKEAHKSPHLPPQIVSISSPRNTIKNHPNIS